MVDSPQFSEQAEESILGAILINPALLDDVQLEIDDFYIERHRHIWRAIKHLDDDGSSIDILTITNQLEKDGKLNAVGGAAEITSLLTATPTGLYIRDHEKIVKDLSMRRKGILALQETAKTIRDSSSKPDSILDELEKLRVLIANTNNEFNDPWKLFTLPDAYQEREPVQHIAENLFAIPSLNIVYGAPGTLKSFLLADLAMCVASGSEWLPSAPWIEANAPKSIGVYQSPVIWLDFDNGIRRTHDRLGALARSRNILESVPFYYYSMPSPWLNADDKTSMINLSLRIQARRAKLVVIDNLRVVSGSSEENSGEMSVVMSEFRQLAEETEAAVVLIHHQRKSTANTGRVGDSLRGHSSIEAALDLALMIKREEFSDTVNIRATKTRGADVLPFSAVFTYDDKPNGELDTARFFGLVSEDLESDSAIRREIPTALHSEPLNKTDLAKAVKNKLPDVGINRIRDMIERMASKNKIRLVSGKSPNEKMYSIAYAK